MLKKKRRERWVVVGQVPKCLSLWISMSMLLRLPKSSINCKVTGNKVNKGAGNGLKIPCEYSAGGDKLWTS